MPNITWKKVPVQYNAFGKAGGNVIYEPQKGKWRVSYNDFKEGGRSELFESLNVALTGDRRTDDETALYDGNSWRILWGDHRKAYEKAIPKGLKACIAVYDKLRPKYHCDKWSTDQ